MKGIETNLDTQGLVPVSLGMTPKAVEILLRLAVEMIMAKPNQGGSEEP